MTGRASHWYRELPGLMRIGFGLAASGALVDIGYHLAVDAPGMGTGPVALAGHVTTLVGMVVTMLGVFGAALKRRPLDPQPEMKGQPS